MGGAPDALTGQRRPFFCNHILRYRHGRCVLPTLRCSPLATVHYADAEPSGTRIYRDSLPKMSQAVADITKLNPDFLIELGDFKDTDATERHCDKNPTAACVNLTLGFLQRIEEAVAVFPGPRYHVIGNHDVDILNQSSVFAHEVNSHIDERGGAGFYSWSVPQCSAPPCAERQPLRF